MNKILGILLILLIPTICTATVSFSASAQITDDGYNPDLFCDNMNQFHVVWQVYNSTETLETISYARSADQGRSWGWQADIIDSATAIYGSYNPVLTVGQSGIVYVTWTMGSFLLAGTDGERYKYLVYETSRCINPRATTPTFSLFEYTESANSTDDYMYGSHLPTRPTIAVENVNGVDQLFVACVVYNNTAAYNYGIAGAYTDSAEVWQGRIGTTGLIAIADTAGGDKFNHPSMAVQGLSYDNDNEVYIAFTNTTDQSIVVDVSTDGFATWGTDVQISDASKVASHPSLVVTKDILTTDSGDDLFCVWTDNINKIASIYFDYSSDGGSAWETDTILGDSDYYVSFTQSEPDIAVGKETGYLYVVYKSGQSGAGDIRFQESRWSGTAFVWGIDHNNDGVISGSTEVGKDVKVDDNATDNEQSNPQIAVDENGNVLIVWYDSTIGSLRSSRRVYSSD